MSDKKTIAEALAEVQRKINEQRMKNSMENYNTVNEQGLMGSPEVFNAKRDAAIKAKREQAAAAVPTAAKAAELRAASAPERAKNIAARDAAARATTKKENPAVAGYGGIAAEYGLTQQARAANRASARSNEADTEDQQLAASRRNGPIPSAATATPATATPATAAPSIVASAPKLQPSTFQGNTYKEPPKPAAAPAASTVSAAQALGQQSQSGYSRPGGITGNISNKFSTDKPAASAPVAKPAAPTPAAKPAAPTPAAPKFAQSGSDDDTSANFFAADAARMRAQGQRAPNDFSPETESGKPKEKKKMSESTNPMIAAFLALQETNPQNMFEAMKKKLAKNDELSDKDWDGDGKRERPKDEVWGSRFRAARKAGKMEEGVSSDPDMAVPRRKDAPVDNVTPRLPELNKEIKQKPAPSTNVPLPPPRPKNLKETEEVGFSEAELAHFASVFETAVAPQTDKNAADVGQRPESEILDEGGRKKDKEENPNTANGRDPRQHIQVIAGRAMSGTALPFKHNDGTTSKITAAMGRAITSRLQGLKPADRQAAVNRMHDSADGLRG